MTAIKKHAASIVLALQSVACIGVIDAACHPIEGAAGGAIAAACVLACVYAFRFERTR